MIFRLLAFKIGSLLDSITFIFSLPIYTLVFVEGTRV